MAFEAMTDLEGWVELSSLIDTLIQYRHDGYTHATLKEVPHGYNTKAVLVLEMEPVDANGK